jgi:hypothetical protein
LLIPRAILSILVLSAVFGAPAQASEPVYRMSDTCTMPMMPGKGSTKQDWDTYALLVRDYNECLAAKAGKVGKRAKEALEDVGDTVTGWTETAAGWFQK